MPVQWGWLQGVSYLTYFRYTTSGMLRLQYTDRNDNCGLGLPSVPAMPPSQAGFAYPTNSTVMAPTAMPPVPAHVDPCQQVGLCWSITPPGTCCDSSEHESVAADVFQQHCGSTSHVRPSNAAQNLHAKLCWALHRLHAAACCHPLLQAESLGRLLGR